MFPYGRQPPGSGFSSAQSRHAIDNPTHLLAGILRYSKCGGGIGRVRGKADGYLGCLRSRTGSCDNRVLVRKDLAEQLILDTVRRTLCSDEVIDRVLDQMRTVPTRLHGDIPGLCRSKSAEITKLEKRTQNMVAFIAAGHASESVATSLAETEQRLRCSARSCAPLSSAASRSTCPARSGSGRGSRDSTTCSAGGWGCQARCSGSCLGQ